MLSYPPFMIFMSILIMIMMIKYDKPVEYAIPVDLGVPYFQTNPNGSKHIKLPSCTMHRWCSHGCEPSNLPLNRHKCTSQWNDGMMDR
jgi:hypothetical protein